LSALVEQLKLPKVQHMLNIYSHNEGHFEDVHSDLNKYYVEAKDNVRFLSTLERHFKNIAHGVNFQVGRFYQDTRYEI
jgi:dynein heavy chain